MTIQVTVESTNTLERRLKVQVPSDEIEKEVQNRLARVGKTAKLKGFRPGKIPATVVRRQFGGQVRREVLGDVMQRTFLQAVEQEDLNPAGGPTFEPGELDEGKDLEYTATFEVYPDIKLTKTTGLAAVRKEAEVGDADVDRMLEQLRSQRMEWVDVARAAAEGDQVVIDFTGRLDGEVFAGGEASDYPATIGAGALLKDMEDGLIGMAKGDEKEIDVTFPDDYHATELAGKHTRFTLTAKAVKEQSLPDIDAAFAESFGVEDGDIDEFKKAVRANMEREAADKVATELRDQILAALVKENPVDLPKILVDREVEQLQRDSMRRFGMDDVSSLPREPFEEQGRKRVALGLLVGEILSQNEIRAEREKVDARVAALAAGQPDPSAAIAQMRGDANTMQQIEMMVLEEQVVDQLIADADIEVKTISFAELMDVQQ